MSSRKANSVFHAKPRRTKFILLAYVPGALHNPKLILTHSKSPNFVVNAVFLLSSGFIPTCQYALLASSFEYQMFPAKVSSHSSINGKGKTSLTVTEFKARYSMHHRTPPSRLRINTGADVHSEMEG